MRCVQGSSQKGSRHPQIFKPNCLDVLGLARHKPPMTDIPAPTCFITQSVYASVAHRYWNQEWSAQKNRDEYGDLASEEGIGSNLRIELTGTNEGTVGRSLTVLKEMVDHQCLFAPDSPHFAKPSTLENIAGLLAEAI